KIKGKCEFDVNGNTRALEWEAKRDTAQAAVASGNWNTALILSDGNRIEGTLKLKQDGDKLTGATIRNENETPIQDGKIAGDEITFRVIRDRDGRKVTAKYKGKIAGDTVKGKVESDWSGDWQTFDWEGTRGKMVCSQRNYRLADTQRSLHNSGNLPTFDLAMPYCRTFGRSLAGNFR
ncbi:MAG: hypothetical protein JWM99_647, partial [Verrucomicrobiales bacterium]|nr:hypothetical protein [Verrucomicrobiales bacterium]